MYVSTQCLCIGDKYRYMYIMCRPILLDFSLTVKAATLTFISACGSAIPSAKEGKSVFL